MNTSDNTIDVKKIMEQIRQDIGQKDSMNPLQSNLKERSKKRAKSKHYIKTKDQLFLEKNPIQKQNNDLNYNLHQANISTDIDVHQSIKSGRNKLVRWLALKMRHVIQNEIRFTLNPILENQTFHNSHIVRTLNDVVYFFKKQDQTLQEHTDKLTSQDQTLQEHTDKIIRQIENLEFLKQELIKSEVKRIYNTFLKREPEESEIQNYSHSIMTGKLTSTKMIDDVKSSPEFKKIKYQEHIETQTMVKKFNDMTEFSSNVEKFPILDIVDLVKIAYYNKMPLTERFTEYAWTLKNLTQKGNLLDVGCSESLFTQEISKLPNLKVSGIDIREPEYQPQFSFYKISATKTNFDDEFFDQITIISSIEHFGLDFYGNKIVDPNADFATMKEMHRILKKEGIILVTVPYGIGDKFYYRKYDENRLERLFADFEIVEKKYCIQTMIGWKETNSDTALKAGDSNYYQDLELPAAIVFVKAKRSQ